jgi:hypothetical protein
MASKLIASVLVLTSVLSVAGTSNASAHERWRYEVDKRQAKQHQLIHEGRRSGALTWREALKLKREQLRIARMERAFRADGRLSKSERLALRYAQDSATTHIFEERNDGQQRRRWW